MAKGGTHANKQTRATACLGGRRGRRRRAGLMGKEGSHVSMTSRPLGRIDVLGPGGAQAPRGAGIRQMARGQGNTKYSTVLSLYDSGHRYRVSYQYGIPTGCGAGAGDVPVSRQQQVQEGSPAIRPLNPQA